MRQPNPRCRGRRSSCPSCEKPVSSTPAAREWSPSSPVRSHLRPVRRSRSKSPRQPVASRRPASARSSWSTRGTKNTASASSSSSRARVWTWMRCESRWTVSRPRRWSWETSDSPACTSTPPTRDRYSASLWRWARSTRSTFRTWICSTRSSCRFRAARSGPLSRSSPSRREKALAASSATWAPAAWSAVVPP